MTKKNIWLGVIGAVVLAGAGMSIWYFGSWGGDKNLLRQISDQPDLVKIFDKAVAGEASIKKSPEKAELYLTAALDWKTIGELSRKEDFFRRSLTVYEKGIEKFGSKNILFYLNGGKVAERLRDYPKAEKYFKAAIEISPGDETGYVDLLDLYSYKMNKPKAEILAMLAQGEKTMVSNTGIVSARATYLRRIEDYSGALVDYNILVERYPNNAGYKAIVAGLENLLK